jgi:hypothetical protein
VELCRHNLGITNLCWYSLYIDSENVLPPSSISFGRNILRRHLHIMGLCNDPICRKCGTEEENSVHILCECEALASLRHVYLGFFFLDPEDIRELGMDPSGTLLRGHGSYSLIQNMGHRGPVN